MTCVIDDPDPCPWAQVARRFRDFQSDAAVIAAMQIERRLSQLAAAKRLNGVVVIGVRGVAERRPVLPQCGRQVGGVAKAGFAVLGVDRPIEAG